MKYFRNLIAPIVAAVLSALLVAGVANGAFYQWSKTSATNATADPTINWAEGMSPSSVNDSARAMMARAAEYRDDISGSLATGGTSTAFTLATNQGLPATPTDGQLIAFTPHATNGAAPTLAADSGTAFAIQTSPGVAVTSGTLVQGTPYTAKFSLTDTAWILRNFYGSAFTVPIGGIIPYTGTTAPNSSFILPYGQCISRTTYAAYFAQVSDTFGTCDGVTTFGVPDLRGRTIAGLGNMGGTDAARLTATTVSPNGTTIGAVGGTQTVTLTIAQMPAHDHGGVTGSGVLSRQFSQSFGSGDDYFTATGIASSLSGPSAVPALSISSQGSGNAHPIVQPTMVLTMILRVL